MNSGRLIECCVVAVLFAGVCGPAIAEEFPSSPEPSLYAGAVGIEWGGPFRVCCGWRTRKR